ncbi:hypothetical protein C0J52_08221, partial [Blattella germanica]
TPFAKKKEIYAVWHKHFSLKLLGPEICKLYVEFPHTYDSESLVNYIEVPKLKHYRKRLLSRKSPISCTRNSKRLQSHVQLSGTIYNYSVISFKNYNSVIDFLSKKRVKIVLLASGCALSIHCVVNRNASVFSGDKSIDELKGEITNYVNSINQETLQKVFQNKCKRVELCLQQQGQHFQHLLIKLLRTNYIVQMQLVSNNSDESVMTKPKPKYVVISAPTGKCTNTGMSKYKSTFPTKHQILIDKSILHYFSPKARLPGNVARQEEPTGFVANIHASEDHTFVDPLPTMQSVNLVVPLSPTSHLGFELLWQHLHLSCLNLTKSSKKIKWLFQIQISLIVNDLLSSIFITLLITFPTLLLTIIIHPVPQFLLKSVVPSGWRELSSSSPAEATNNSLFKASTWLTTSNASKLSLSLSHSLRTKAGTMGVEIVAFSVMLSEASNLSTIMTSALFFSDCSVSTIMTSALSFSDCSPVPEPICLESSSFLPKPHTCSYPSPISGLGSGAGFKSFWCSDIISTKLLNFESRVEAEPDFFTDPARPDAPKRSISREIGKLIR